MKKKHPNKGKEHPITPIQQKIIDMKVEGKIVRHVDIAKELGIHPTTISRTLSLPKVQRKLEQKTQALRRKQAKIGNITHIGATKGLQALQILVSRMTDKLDEGEDLHHSDINQLHELTKTLFTANAKAHELGLDMDGSNDISDDEAAALSTQVVQLFRMGLHTPHLEPHKLHEVQELIFNSVFTAGLIPIDKLLELLDLQSSDIQYEDEYVADVPGTEGAEYVEDIPGNHVAEYEGEEEGGAGEEPLVLDITPTNNEVEAEAE